MYVITLTSADHTHNDAAAQTSALPSHGPNRSNFEICKVIAIVFDSRVAAQRFKVVALVHREELAAPLCNP
jgi:hypothetical protein